MFKMHQGCEHTKLYLTKILLPVLSSPAEHTVKGHINYKFVQTEKKNIYRTCRKVQNIENVCTSGAEIQCNVKVSPDKGSIS